jgi:hypothetical protein
MEEIWKDIEGYEAIYQVSNTGQVKSLKSLHAESGLILKIHNQIKGYSRVNLWKKGVCKSATIHRLVAMSFIENKDNKNQVNHKDGVKSNNCVENLEWCNASQNMIHAYKIGLKKPNVLSKTHREKMSEINSKNIIDVFTGVVYKSIRMASKFHPFTETYLSMMLRGERPNKTNLQYYNPTKQ